MDEPPRWSQRFPAPRKRTSRPQPLRAANSGRNRNLRSLRLKARIALSGGCRTLLAIPKDFDGFQERFPDYV
jgi:hypothetical protein